MIWKRSADEIRAAFAIQCRALEASCKAYDAGDEWEALRLATTVHIMVHDGGKNSRSLLTQMGVKSSMRFLASGQPASSKNYARQIMLAWMRVYSDGRAMYVPYLDSGQKPYRIIQFPRWWEDELIFLDGDCRLNRRRLVFALRSQEGGAHFDEEQKNPNYIRLARESITTWRVAKGDSESKAILGAEFVLMRQIAWELMASLDKAGIA
jgi:hypothetical protein